MPQDFSKEEDFMISLLICLDRVNDGGGLIYHNGLQPIFLVQICLKILFHCFSAVSVLINALVIVLNFLQVNVCY